MCSHAAPAIVVDACHRWRWPAIPSLVHERCDCAAHVEESLVSSVVVGACGETIMRSVSRKRMHHKAQGYDHELDTRRAHPPPRSSQHTHVHARGLTKIEKRSARTFVVAKWSTGATLNRDLACSRCAGCSATPESVVSETCMLVEMRAQQPKENRRVEVPTVRPE